MSKNYLFYIENIIYSYEINYIQMHNVILCTLYKYVIRSISSFDCQLLVHNTSSNFVEIK